MASCSLQTRSRVSNSFSKTYPPSLGRDRGQSRQALIMYDPELINVDDF